MWSSFLLCPLFVCTTSLDAARRLLILPPVSRHPVSTPGLAHPLSWGGRDRGVGCSQQLSRIRGGSQDDVERDANGIAIERFGSIWGGPVLWREVSWLDAPKHQRISGLCPRTHPQNMLRCSSMVTRVISLQGYYDPKDDKETGWEVGGSCHGDCVEWCDRKDP